MGKVKAEWPSLTKGTEYYGLNEVFSNISIAYLKKKKKKKQLVDYMSFAVIQWFLSAGSFQPSSASQAPCAYQVLKQLLLGWGLGSSLSFKPH